MADIMECASPSSSEDIQIIKVVTSYKASLPKEYNKLFARYLDQVETCVKCQEIIDTDCLGIFAGDSVFHSICLFYEHKFTGKVTEIEGFSSLNNDDRDLLREIPSADGGAEEEDDEEDEDYSDGDLYGSEDEVEPPPKRSPSSYTCDVPMITITSKEKTRERLAYDDFLQSISPESLRTGGNPERVWGQKDDPGSKPAVVKRGCLVDKEFGDAANCWVFKTEKGDLYSITLCQTDIVANRNCYFKMQVLKHDNMEIYYVFRSWGRIGTKRGSTFSETFHSSKEALDEFEKDFETLTGNKWREKHFFNVKDNYMSMVEMDYTELETLICGPDGKLIPAGSKSSLHFKVKSILLKIFDAKNIKKALDGYNFDLERMPMGKLSAMQVSRANGILRQVKEFILKKGPGTPEYEMISFDREIIGLSNKFYSLLPQSFGHGAPLSLSKPGQSEKMEGMIDALLDIQFVLNIMNDVHRDAQLSGMDPIDLQYNKLMTRMEVVPEDHDDYKFILTYITNGMGVTHGYKGIQLLDLIRLERFGEAAKFRKHYGNRKLLWHGSPIQNFPGILTQGLRIAPADAIQTGHAFGRGVYFADMISKSANYCRVLNPVRHVRTRPPTGAINARPQFNAAAPNLLNQHQQLADELADQENIGYLLLCDVALGNSKELTYGSSTGISSTDTQFQSVKGVGETYPDPAADHLHPDGYTIPLGKCVRNSNGHRHGGFLYYNEFIVYDTDQICARYLCRVKFDHYH